MFRVKINLSINNFILWSAERRWAALCCTGSVKKYPEASLLCILGAVNHIKERKQHHQCRKSCHHRQVGWQWLSSSPPSTYPSLPSLSPLSSHPSLFSFAFHFSCFISSITLSPSVFLVSLHSSSHFVLSFVLSMSHLLLSHPVSPTSLSLTLHLFFYFSLSFTLSYVLLASHLHLSFLS